MSKRAVLIRFSDSSSDLANVLQDNIALTEEGKMWFRALKKYRSEPTLEYVVNQAARNAAGLRR